MLHAVAMGQLDLSFILGAPHIPKHESRILWHESVYAVLPQEHELAPRESLTSDDLREESFIVSRGGLGAEVQDYLTRNLSSSGRGPRVEVHDVSRGNLLNLVAMGYGITLTTSTSGSDLNGLAFRPIVGERDVLLLSAVWLAANDNPALRHLLRLAEELPGN
jgi:DNA-binding transcriptional LysR family regulator